VSGFRRLIACSTAISVAEKEAHWGGNAYAMEYEGSMYATGSAFLAKDGIRLPLREEIGLEPLR